MPRIADVVTDFPVEVVTALLGPAVDRAVQAVAPEIERRIKAVTPVDTGALQESVRVRAVRGPNRRLEVKTTFYGPFVEFGTSKMQAQPFILPVLSQAQWPRRIAQLVKQEIRAKRKALAPKARRGR